MEGLPVEGLPVGGLPVERLPAEGLPVEGLPVEGLPPEAADDEALEEREALLEGEGRLGDEPPVLAERLDDDGEDDGDGGEGDDGEGGEGGLGAWGLRTLEQALSTRQAATARPAAIARAPEKLGKRAARGSMRRAALPVCRVIGPAKSPGAYRHAVAEAGPEWCLSQAAHNLVRLRVVLAVRVEPL